MTLVTVVAPSNLKEGYTLQVEIDGKNATVICPYDVKTGEKFEVVAVEYEPLVKPSQAIIIPIELDSTQKLSSTVTGEFQYGLCSCMDGRTCCSGVWWMSRKCLCIAIAQLLNRFRWNACAVPTQQSRLTNFLIIIGLNISYFICYFVYGLSIKCDTITDTNLDTSHNTVQKHCYAPGAWWILGLVVNAMWIYYIVLLVRIRIGFRKHYNIPGNCFADCCTMYFCTCCSMIQMLRQTHDEKQYPYNCCNCLTGLDDDAPEIV